MTLNAAAIQTSLDTIMASTTAAAEDITTVKASLKATDDRINSLEAINRRPGSRHDNDNSDIKAELGAMALFARSGDETGLQTIQAAMSVGSAPDGGYLVMPALSSGMTKKLYDTTAMRRLARVETITAGSDWVEPIDNGEAGASWVGEQSARPKTSTPQLGQLRVELNEIYALQTVTQRLIDDTGFNLGSWIDDKITDKFSRTEGAAFLTGDGVNKPRGFLTYPAVATTDATRPWGSIQFLPSGGVTSITGDALKDIVWGLRAPYRAGSSWLMNSNTAAQVDKLKDGQGNYLWRIGAQVGAPDQLLGYPVEIDESMPDIAAGSMPIAFGNFKLAYVIIDRAGIRFLRDPFSDKPNLLFYAYRRVGGGLANSEAIKLVKIGTS